MLRDLRPLGTTKAPARFFGPKGNRRIRLSAARPEPTEPAPGHSLGRVLVCLGLATALAAGAYGLRLALLRGDRFALTEVRVSPLSHVDPAALIARSGLPLGRSIFALDLAEAERRISREPWVKSVRVRRELPHVVAIEVVEREVRATVALGALYLVDGNGDVFKRARPDEAAGLPVVTGVTREHYLADPVRGRAVLRRALEVDRLWREHGTRPAPGELHHEAGRDAAATFTVYFTHAGQPVGVRLGNPDQTTADRLARLDAVLAALDREGAHAQVIHLDQRAQLDRVAVRLSDVTTNRQNGVAAGDAEAQAL